LVVVVVVVVSKVVVVVVVVLRLIREHGVEVRLLRLV
jgi:hypothetical protein